MYGTKYIYMYIRELVLPFLFALSIRGNGNSFDRGGNAIFARMPPRPTTGRSREEMHRADYLEPRKWNTVISVSRERNPISLLRRGFVRIPRNKGKVSFAVSLSTSRRYKIEEKGAGVDDNFSTVKSLYLFFFFFLKSALSSISEQ